MQFEVGTINHIQVAVEVLKNTASQVKVSQLRESVGKIVSLSEMLTSALRYVHVQVMLFYVMSMICPSGQ